MKTGKPWLVVRLERRFLLRFHEDSLEVIHELLWDDADSILRKGSVILAFLTAAHFPLADPSRYAIPSCPALFLFALGVSPIIKHARYLNPN